MAKLKKYLMISRPTCTAYRIASGEWKRFVLLKDDYKIPSDYRGELIICSNEEKGLPLQDSLSLVALVNVTKIDRTGELTVVEVDLPVKLVEEPFRATDRLDWYEIPEEIIMPYPDPKNVARWQNKKKVW